MAPVPTARRATVTRASSAPQVTRRCLIAAVPALAAGSSNTQRLTGGGYKIKTTEGSKAANLNGGPDKIWAHPNDWEQQYKQKSSYYEELLAKTVANQSK